MTIGIEFVFFFGMLLVFLMMGLWAPIRNRSRRSDRPF